MLEVTSPQIRRECRWSAVYTVLSGCSSCGTRIPQRKNMSGDATIADTGASAGAGAGAGAGATADAHTTAIGFRVSGPAAIVTARLVFRPLTTERGQAVYVKAYADKEHLTILSNVLKPRSTSEGRQAYIDQQLEQWADRTRYQYVVYERADGRSDKVGDYDEADGIATGDEVGMLCLFHPSHDPELCELG